MTPALQSDLPSPKATRTLLVERIVMDGTYLALGAAMLIATLVVTLLTQSTEGGDYSLQTHFLVALGSLVAAMLVVRGLYVRSERFLFSPTFWLLVTFLFYFVFKALDMADKDLVTPTLVSVLWLCTLFLVTYFVAYALTDASLHRRNASGARLETVVPRRCELTLFIIYVGFKLLGLALLSSAGGDTVLEVAAATQNAGAAYIYRIPAAGNVILLALLLNAFKNNRGWIVVGFALAFYMVEAVLSTNRLSLVMMVLWIVFLYHRYIHPTSLIRVAFIGLPLVLVVVLFGYARNVGVGSAAAYVEAASMLVEEPRLITELFMGRMDMLPQMVSGLDLHQSGVLPDLYGGSYVYAFMHAVPRSLWEGKPLLTAALVTSYTHPGAFADGVNIFPSIVLEGYLNLGLAGVMLPGALVGVFSRQFERAIEIDHLVPNVWTLSMLTFPMALFNEGVHSNFTGMFLYTTALHAVLYWILLSLGILKRRRTVS